MEAFLAGTRSPAYLVNLEVNNRHERQPVPDAVELLLSDVAPREIKLRDGVGPHAEDALQVQQCRPLEAGERCRIQVTICGIGIQAHAHQSRLSRVMGSCGAPQRKHRSSSSPPALGALRTWLQPITHS
jgi:hypothetical protein